MTSQSQATPHYVPDRALREKVVHRLLAVGSTNSREPDGICGNGGCWSRWHPGISGRRHSPRWLASGSGHGTRGDPGDGGWITGGIERGSRHLGDCGKGSSNSVFSPRVVAVQRCGFRGKGRIHIRHGPIAARKWGTFHLIEGQVVVRDTGRPATGCLKWWFGPDLLPEPSPPSIEPHGEDIPPRPQAPQKIGPKSMFLIEDSQREHRGERPASYYINVIQSNANADQLTPLL